jgi:hypothetical protein
MTAIDWLGQAASFALLVYIGIWKIDPRQSVASQSVTSG